MNLRIAGLGLACSIVPFVSVAVEQLTTVFFEGFDRYGDYHPEYADCELWEAPPSFKSLNCNPKDGKATAIRVEPFRCEAAGSNYDLSFRFWFADPSAREFTVNLMAHPAGAGKTAAFDVTVAEKGSSFAGAKTTVPGNGFPARYWHNGLIRVRGNDMQVWVERNGLMTLDATGPAPKYPLTAFNITTKTQVQLDDLRIRVSDSSAMPGPLPANADFLIPLPPEETDGLVEGRTNAVRTIEIKPGDTELVFSVRAGDGKLKPTVRLVTADGNKLEYKLRLFGTKQNIPVRRMKDGAFTNTTDAIDLPDQGIAVTGPDINVNLNTRPDLKWRYTSEGVMGAVATWDRMPPASKRLLPFRFVRDDAGVQLWLGASYAGRIKLASALTSIEIALPDGSAFRQGYVGATRTDTKQSLLLPLETGLNPHPGTLADAVVPDSLRGYKTVNGIPFIVSDGAHSLDLGRCRENLGSFDLESDGFLGRNAFDGVPSSMLFQVPRASYVKAYALCLVAENEPDRVPVVTARIAQYTPAGKCMTMSDSRVVLPKRLAEAKALPPNVRLAGTAKHNGKDIGLYFVEFSFDVGSLQDILTNGKDYLHFDLIGELATDHDNYYLLRTRKPSDTLSSVSVVAATLERCPVEFASFQNRTANMYYPDEKPGMTGRLTAVLPGAYTLDWRVTDITGKEVGKGTSKVAFAKAGEEQSVAIDFAQKDLGWYGVRFSVKDAKGTELIGQDASFVLLAPDTRKAGYESPYFSWNFAGAHGTPSDPAVYGDILMRMGVRRAGLPGPEKDFAKWKLTIGHFNTPSSKGTNDAERETSMGAQIKALCEKYPHVKSAMIFHESLGGPVPKELWGGKSDFDENTLKHDKVKCDQAVFMARMWRKFAPDVKLLLGNSNDSIGGLARLFRAGLPRDLIDYMGEETVGLTEIAERGSAYHAWQLQELARVYGYQGLMPNAAYEWKTRVIRHFTPRDHAAQRTRDALICLAWDYTLVPVIGISEMYNAYYNTIWGDAAFTRNPLLNPFPVAAATAVLTEAMDQVKFSRMIPTGSATAYAAEFTRRDGKVYALWTARGEVEAEVTFAKDGGGIMTGIYGARTPVTTAGGKYKVKLSGEPCYLTGTAPVTAVSVAMQRSYPNEYRPEQAKAVVANAMDKVAEWELVQQTDKRLEDLPPNPVYLAVKQLGKYDLRQAKDDSMGDCLEIELIKEGQTSPLVQEYTMLRLKQPAEVKGEPNTIGVWVKGNSSWAKLFWEFEDADGERWFAAGSGGYGCMAYDWPEISAVDFDGWHFLQFPITDKSPVKVHAPGENQWQWQHSGNGDHQVTYPIKLTGFAVSMPRQSLYIRDMVDITPVLRFRNFSTY